MRNPEKFEPKLERTESKTEEECDETEKKEIKPERERDIREEIEGIKEKSEKALEEQEAMEKVVDLIQEKNLLFHATQYQVLPIILEKGLMSKEFYERAFPEEKKEIYGEFKKWLQASRQISVWDPWKIIEIGESWKKGQPYIFKYQQIERKEAEARGLKIIKNLGEAKGRDMVLVEKETSITYEQFPREIRDEILNAATEDGKKQLILSALRDEEFGPVTCIIKIPPHKMEKKAPRGPGGGFGTFTGNYFELTPETTIIDRVKPSEIIGLAIDEKKVKNYLFSSIHFLEGKFGFSLESLLGLIADDPKLSSNLRETASKMLEEFRKQEEKKVNEAIEARKKEIEESSWGAEFEKEKIKSEVARNLTKALINKPELKIIFSRYFREKYDLEKSIDDITIGDYINAIARKYKIPVYNKKADLLWPKMVSHEKISLNTKYK